MFLLASCAELSATNNSKDVTPENSFIPSNREFTRHFNELAEDFIVHNKTTVIELTGEPYKYLSSIIEKLWMHNELILKNFDTPKFYLILNKSPIFFPFPNNKFFFSSGLILKYLKSEDLLNGIISLMALRNSFGVFYKKIIPPTGNYNISQMISLSKLSIDYNVEVYKWTFYIQRRSGMNPTSLLNLIQLQNKNSLDFMVQNGSLQGTAREEYLFKSFIVSQGLGELAVGEKNSSQSFYKLMQVIKGYVR